MVLNWKKMECSLQVGDESLSQVEEFKYLVHELWQVGARDGQTDWGFISGNEGGALICRGEEGAEPEG